MTGRPQWGATGNAPWHSRRKGWDATPKGSQSALLCCHLHVKDREVAPKVLRRALCGGHQTLPRPSILRRSYQAAPGPSILCRGRPICAAANSKPARIIASWGRLKAVLISLNGPKNLKNSALRVYASARVRVYAYARVYARVYAVTRSIRRFWQNKSQNIRVREVYAYACVPTLGIAL